MASRQVEKWDGSLWFFTKKSSPKVQEAKQNLDQVNVSYSDPNQMSFVSISGKAELVDDKAKLKELWSPYLKVFFPQGLEDPDLTLMKVTANYGEYWDSPSNKMVQLYSMVKAAATKNPQALGENEKIDIKHKKK
jgi:general stress protein 26